MVMRNTAHIILYNGENKVYLQHRDDKAPTNPNTIGLFGGGIKQNERPLDAIRRECLQAIGYNLNRPKLLEEGEYKEVSYCGKRYVYIKKYDDISFLKCCEGKKGEWLAHEDIMRSEKILPIDKKVLKKFYREKSF